MQKLLAKNLYIGNLRIIYENKIESVIVYKKDDRYYDMKNIFSKADFKKPEVVFYKETPTYNNWYDLIVHIEKESLKNFYTDEREIFDIYEFHNEFDSKIKTKSK